jgi:threonyl-tRNA synthetase
MLVMGDNEESQSTVALRLRGGENPGPVSIEDFIQRAKKDIEEGI